MAQEEDAFLKLLATTEPRELTRKEFDALSHDEIDNHMMSYERRVKAAKYYAHEACCESECINRIQRVADMLLRQSTMLRWVCERLRRELAN